MFLLTNKTEKNDDVGIIKCNHRNIRPNSGTVNFVIELIIFILDLITLLEAGTMIVDPIHLLLQLQNCSQNVENLR